ncbi:MAG TPA: hypothetical protein P5556_02140 [Candidatus Gastranaerophilales bacterium]|nr:hypothetical protein [Candidatus Gastranaerophilales bacterium]
MEEKILQALAALNGRFDNLEHRFDKLEKRFDNLEQRFDLLEIQTKENTEMLRALVHSAEVNKAEHDQINITLAKMEGNQEALTKDLRTVEAVTANNYSFIVNLKTMLKEAC